LRVGSAALWTKLTLEEQRRFLRHLRPYYDAHRYRATPDVAAVVEQARRDGRFEASAGRIADVRVLRSGFAVEIAPRSPGAGPRTLEVAAIVIAPGPGNRWIPRTAASSEP
jgi:uncharacterized NAD(P)/FAD-binding protein YdhS